MQESAYKYKTAGWLEELARTMNIIKLAGYTDMHLRKTNTIVNGGPRKGKDRFVFASSIPVGVITVIIVGGIDVLDACNDVMHHASRLVFTVYRVRQNRALALGSINVAIQFNRKGRSRETGGRGAEVTGNVNVLVQLVVIAMACHERALQGIGKFMLVDGLEDVGFMGGEVLAWVGEYVIVQGFYGFSVVAGRNTAVNEALLVQVLIGEIEGASVA